MVNYPRNLPAGSSPTHELMQVRDSLRANVFNHMNFKVELETYK